MDAALEERGALAIIGKALSDPVSVEMLGMMAEGRTCCGLPDLGAPVGASDADDPGICVCEFVEHFDLLSSRQAQGSRSGKGRTSGKVELLFPR